MGVKVGIKANGMTQYRKKLEKMGRSMGELEKPMREAGEIATALVQSYPPYGDWKHKKVSFQVVRPGSKYKRTRTLQKGWRGQLTKGSNITFRYKVYNYGTPYGKYVQGEEQVSVHRGWWYTEGEMAKMMHTITLEIFRKFMKDVAKGK